MPGLCRDGKENMSPRFYESLRDISPKIKPSRDGINTLIRQSQKRARADKLQQEQVWAVAGKTHCELCLGPARLVPWDEREHGGGACIGRNPIWRICASCHRAAFGAEGRREREAREANGPPW